MSKQNIDPTVYQEQKVWGLEGNEDYFTSHRSRPDHLYRSEKFFLPEVLARVDDCLDVGCACGDFSAIFKNYNPQIKYTGVDIIERFVRISRQRYPQERFELSDGISLDFPDRSFDLVHSSGILHLNSRYADIVREMYRVAKCYVLCDFRLTDGPDVVGELDVNLVGQEGAAQTLPYYVVNITQHLEFLKSLVPAPDRIEVKGYVHPPSKSARVATDKIYMAFFLITKSPQDNSGPTEIKVNLDL